MVEMTDGSINIVKGGDTFLTTATSDDDKATFSTNNKLYFLSDTFYRGKYYANGISLYDLAVIVLVDGGIDNYYINPYLKNVYTKNSLPITTHKACLQLIAIAGQFKMFGLTMEFGGCEPQEVVIHQYNNNVLVGDITVDEFTATTYISDEFQILYKMIIEFTKAKEHNRIRVNKITFGDVTDYTLTYDEMTKTPSA